jgi:hypothetical protein
MAINMAITATTRAATADIVAASNAIFEVTGDVDDGSFFSLIISLFISSKRWTWAVPLSSPAPKVFVVQPHTQHSPESYLIPASKILSRRSSSGSLAGLTYE